MHDNDLKKVVVLQQNTSASEAARAMYEKNIGCVLVSNGRGEIIGIVTDRDIACGVLGLGLHKDTPLHEIMSPNPKFVTPLETAKILSIMQKHAIRRVPIIEFSENGSQKCVGIVTLDDLILGGEIKLSNLRPIVRKQMRTSIRSLSRNERRELHKEQTLHRFNKILASHMKLDRPLAEEVGFFLLKSVIERIPAHMAANFIAELPALMQEDLLDLPAGPNRKINSAWLEKELVDRFHFPDDKVRTVMTEFWLGLEQAIPGGVLDHVLTNLPDDLQVALTSGLEIDVAI